MKIGYLMQKGEEIRRPPYNGPANHVRQVAQGLREDRSARVRARPSGRQDARPLRDQVEHHEADRRTVPEVRAQDP